MCNKLAGKPLPTLEQYFPYNDLSDSYYDLSDRHPIGHDCILMTGENTLR